MTPSSRNVSVLCPVVVAVALSAAGCGGGDGGRAAQARQAGDRALPAGTGYTSDQLRQALASEYVGYRRAGEPDSGEYGSLKGIQNFAQLQRQVTFDKPECADATGVGIVGDPELRTVPAALSTFAKGTGQSAATTLMAVPASAAERHVRVRVPGKCKRFRTKVGGRWSDHEVLESGGGGLGMGSRTVGVATTSGGSAVKTWYVVLRGRGYLATVSLYGPTVTRTEAEQLARQTYDHAERILP
ncbi:hypothetical protein [Thermomonospora umbrina]|uniref:PknH-like protein n=1 Tax=Thermomonospora umbrina TaxID=111806 RepID=A0A3D9T116_9ACTN|nr:hypothetical protein [Thermomonospora umbrina]REE97511.1 hypothetical protein DFJ69_2984 [Thermomonospora umbrina]